MLSLARQTSCGCIETSVRCLHRDFNALLSSSVHMHHTFEYKMCQMLTWAALLGNRRKAKVINAIVCADGDQSHQIRSDDIHEMHTTCLLY